MELKCHAKKYAYKMHPQPDMAQHSAESGLQKQKALWQKQDDVSKSFPIAFGMLGTGKFVSCFQPSGH